MKEKVLITGGSGFLGINLVRYLYMKGYKIRVIDIAPFDYPDMKDKIDFIKGDIRSRKMMVKAVKGMDLIVHTAAALPLYSKNRYLQQILGGQEMFYRQLLMRA